MRSHTTRVYARSDCPTQLAKMNFDKVLDFTADVMFYFTIYQALRDGPTWKLERPEIGVATYWQTLVVSN